MLPRATSFDIGPAYPCLLASAFPALDQAPALAIRINSRCDGRLTWTS